MRCSSELSKWGCHDSPQSCIQWAPHLWLMSEVRAVLWDWPLKLVESEAKSRLLVPELNWVVGHPIGVEKSIQVGWYGAKRKPLSGFFELLHHKQKDPFPWKSPELQVSCQRLKQPAEDLLGEPCLITDSRCYKWLGEGDSVGDSVWSENRASAELERKRVISRRRHLPVVTRTQKESGGFGLK